jgi:hypothetical protein
MKLYGLLRLTILSAAAAGVPASALAARSGGPEGTPACSTGVGCQIADLKGWALSDDNPNGGLSALDNFKVQASGTIQTLCWWGVYFDFSSFADCGPGSGDSFTVTYFNDDACSGIPGSVRAGPLPLVLSNKFATGNVASSSGISMAEYQYEATHAPVAVSAGECVWIEILNHTTQDCFWLWSSAQTADGRSAQSGVLGTTPQPFDLAFCVDIATESDGCNSSLATTYCTAKVNSSGCTPSISARIQGLDLTIDAEQVLAGEVGFLFYSVSGPGGGPFQGGFLCVAPPAARTAPQVASASGTPPCSGVYSFNFTAYAASGKDPSLVGGQQVWAQYWTRDGAAPSGTGLTNALTFTVCR